MILHRAQIEFDTELQLVREMIDALAASGLPWLSDQEHMDVEPGLNDFDPTELEWLASLTRNAKSVLATTITKRFTQANARESQGYPRQLQIVIRILSVVQEFRRLNDILVLAITNNTTQYTLATIINAVGTWHPPLEGMGLLPVIIETIAANVPPPLTFTTYHQWRKTFREVKPSTHLVSLLTHLHTHLASSNPLLAQLVDEFTPTPQYLPLAFPTGASASPLSDHGLENLAIRDISSAEEVFRVLSPSGQFDAPLFQRVLTATAKECTFDIAAMGVFLELLRENDVAQIDELAKEWTMEGIRAVVGGDEGKGVWWIVANLVAVQLVAIEDVISRVVQMVSSPTSGKVSLAQLGDVDDQELSDAQSLELLCHVYELVCAESGTKLCLSLMVRPPL